jgi:hypothetical protein
MDNYEYNKKVFDKQTKHTQKGQLRNDCEKLKFHAHKSCERIGVNALEVIEYYLGNLWGHNSNQELTDQQLFYKDKWLDIRSEILDCTHDAIKVMKQKIDDFEYNRS